MMAWWAGRRANFAMQNLPQTGFVRLNAIIAPNGPIPVGRSTWWAGVKEGRFPKPVKLGLRHYRVARRGHSRFHRKGRLTHGAAAQRPPRQNPSELFILGSGKASGRDQAFPSLSKSVRS